MDGRIQLIKGTIEEVQKQLDELTSKLDCFPNVESVITMGDEILITLVVFE